MNNTKNQIKGVVGKEMVSWPNGAKALLLLRTGRLKAVIDFYEPSQAYHEHVKNVKGNVTQMHIGENGLVRRRISNKTTLSRINRYLKNVWNALMNPAADDSWLDDSEEVAWQKHLMWNNKRPVKPNE